MAANGEEQAAHDWISHANDAGEATVAWSGLSVIMSSSTTALSSQVDL